MHLKKDLLHKLKSNLGPITCALVIMITWIYLSEQKPNVSVGAERTTTNLKRGVDLINRFSNEYEALPFSMVEAKAYGKMQGDSFSAYDAFGNTLEYIRLSDTDFILRSFGADSVQNTMRSETDLVAGKWKTLPKYAANYRYAETKKPHLYPGPLSLGSYAPNGAFFAQVYHDQTSGTRKLVVRSNENAHFQIAPHDFVEEYLWLSDSVHLVYTATSSQRYADGLYIWNMWTGESYNVLDQLERQVGVSGDASSSFFISLAGALANDRSVLAFIARQQGSALNPAEFYRSQNLYEIDVNPDKLNSTKLTALPDTDVHGLLSNISPIENLNAENSNHLTYKAFAKLRLEGHVEEIIGEWQRFTTDYGSSILMPYCLWILSSIYNDAYQLVDKKDPESAAVLRSYGTELASALAQMPASPSYLRAFGEYNFHALKEGTPLPFSISRLNKP